MEGDIDIGAMFLTLYAMLFSYGGWYVLFIINPSVTENRTVQAKYYKPLI